MITGIYKMFFERSNLLSQRPRYGQRRWWRTKAEGMTVKAFKRLEVGEGIEKKQEDFVAEVAAAQAAAAKYLCGLIKTL